MFWINVTVFPEKRSKKQLELTTSNSDSQRFSDKESWEDGSGLLGRKAGASAQDQSLDLKVPCQTVVTVSMQVRRTRLMVPTLQ